ncbi:MAG: GFA family protein [Granulosicoccus sp.]
MSDSNSVTGSCLCGRIKLTIDTFDRGVVYCHCTQCRKQSGHYYAATNASNDKLHIEGAEYITWYAASDSAKRGFCKHCGSVLLWKPTDGSYTAVMAGCLDAPTELAEVSHIFTADKGDYYTLQDGLPQYEWSD